MKTIDKDVLTRKLEAENEKLRQELAIVRQELYDTNSELLQLTLELDDRVARRTRDLQKSEQELRRHRDHLQEMVLLRTRSLADLNQTLEHKLGELAVSEERFRSLVATIPDIVYRIDIDGRFTYVNDAIEKLGYLPKVLHGQHFTSIISSGYHQQICRDKVLSGVRKARQDSTVKLFDERRTGKRKTTGLEVELLSRNCSASNGDSVSGSGLDTVMAEVNSAGLYSNGSGKGKTFIGTVGVIRDITTRKQLEQNLFKAKEELESKVVDRTLELTRKNSALLIEIDKRIEAEKITNEARKQWQEIFDAIGHATIILDGNREILAANRAALKQLGVDATSVLGNRCYELFHKLSEPIESCPVTNLIGKRDGTSCQAEIDIHGKSYLVNCTPVYGSTGDLKNVIHIATDITKTKKLEKELIQAQKMESLGTLAGGIAHDFNNILTIILGFTTLSLDSDNLDDQLRENLGEIRTAGLRAKDLISQILTFARKSDEQPQDVQVGLIAKEVIKLLRSTIPSSITIAGDVQSTAYVRAHPTHLHQILMNLSTNGCQAMEDGHGQLGIRVFDRTCGPEDLDRPLNLRAGSYVVLEVSDTGKGIVGEHLDSIFEPYFTTKPPGAGTGLGLSVVHGIVENCGGKIVVNSEEGVGTTFVVYLPASISPQKSKQREVHHLPEGSEHIFVVDDEPGIVKMTCRLLESLGYSTSSSTSSSQALEEICRRQTEIDLVITDMTMPEMTGDVLTRKIHASCPRIPVIICTGYSSKLDKESAGTIGAVALLAKPLEKEELAHTLRHILGERNPRVQAG